MSNRRFGRSPQLSPEGRKPVGFYNAQELHAFLVADALKFHATYLPWAIAAYDRIASLQRITPDAAYQQVRHDVRSKGGRGMPVHSGPVS